MRPLVQFQRPVETVTGPDIAAFTVVRLERGAMAEGRIQILAHRTEDTVWQPRWLTHRNGALGFIDLVVACADVAEAAARFERFTGHKAQATAFGQAAIALDRGQVQSVFRRSICGDVSRNPMPRLPFIGAYASGCNRCRRSKPVEAGAACAMRRLGAALVVPFPDELGVGAWLFVENAGDLPWRS